MKYDFHIIKKELKSIKEKFAPNQHRSKLQLNATTSLQLLSHLTETVTELSVNFTINTRKLLMFTPNTKRAMPAHESENVQTLQITPLLEGLLLLLSCFSHVRLCVTPQMAAHQAPPSLEFSRQEHWSGLPFPSPMDACRLSRFSRVRLCATPWTAAHQASLSMRFSRQEYWSGLPFPSPTLRAQFGNVSDE